MIKSISTEDAPEAVGPYSQGIVAGNLLFCSGQIPINPETKKLVQDTIEDATKQCLLNLKAVIEKGGSSMDRVLKTTIYLTDLSNFQRVNEVYKEFFSPPFPARACIEVSSLPLQALIEIDAIALLY